MQQINKKAFEFIFQQMQVLFDTLSSNIEYTKWVQITTFRYAVVSWFHKVEPVI